MILTDTDKLSSLQADRLADSALKLDPRAPAIEMGK